MDPGDLEHALRDLIRGDGVRRASHRLEWNGRDVSELFRRILEMEGYAETAVESVPINPGERIPAFHVDSGMAHFGWVFWEVFSPDRKRKIFGSQDRNEKGDWAVILGRRAVIFAAPARKESMDVDLPSSFS
jgi:hypothetical protein